MSKIDHSLFAAQQHALEKEHEACPKCGSELVIRNSKTGPFLGCSSYPQCDYIRSLHHHDTSTIKVLDDTPCPECGHALAVKNGRFGMFIGCTNYPECHHIADMKAEQEKPAELPQCPQCKKGHLVKRASKSGKSFYSCDSYPKCKYSLNYEPVDTPCEACGWPVMVKRNMAQGAVLQCPQKSCAHKQAIQE